jgi:hypothetical protein
MALMVRETVGVAVGNAGAVVDVATVVVVTVWVVVTLVGAGCVCAQRTAADDRKTRARDSFFIVVAVGD